MLPFGEVSPALRGKILLACYHLIMYKQVHNVSPRASISCTPAGVYLYKPPASREEILVRVEVMFVLSWSRPEGVIYCVLAGRECELQFLRAQAAAS